MFGCVITLTNNSKDKSIRSLFNQVREAMQKSTFFEISVNAFQKDPLVIKSSLQGFNNAYKELTKANN